MDIIHISGGVTVISPDICNICPICLDAIIEPVWKCNQCKKSFHRECIKTWEKNNIYWPYYSECPVCKLKYKLYNRDCIYRKILNVNNFVVLALLCAIILVGIIILDILFLIYLFTIWVL